MRPEALVLTPDPAGNATVVSHSFLGSLSRVVCVFDGGRPVTAQSPSAASTGLVPGTRVAVTVAPAPVLVVPA